MNETTESRNVNPRKEEFIKGKERDDILGQRTIAHERERVNSSAGYYNPNRV